MIDLRRVVLVDTSAFLEAADPLRPRHEAVVRELERNWRFLVVPSPCAGEASHLIQRAVGDSAEIAFAESLSRMVLIAPDGEEWIRVAEVMRQYEDFQIGLVDACIVTLAEALNTDLILTLDHRHFRAIKPRHCEFFRLLPEL